MRRLNGHSKSANTTRLTLADSEPLDGPPSGTRTRSTASPSAARSVAGGTFDCDSPGAAAVRAAAGAAVTGARLLAARGSDGDGGGADGAAHAAAPTPASSNPSTRLPVDDVIILQALVHDTGHFPLDARPIGK